MGPYLPVVIALAAALVPAVLVLWRGRTLAALIDDPAFAERRLSSARTVWIEVAIASAVITTTGWRSVLWGIPLLLAARAAAGLPLRKAIYGETWGVAAYLWFLTRLVISVYGFWVVLAATPILVTTIGAPLLTGGIPMALLLCGWHERYPDVLRRLLGAQPLGDPRLAARVSRIAAACGVPSPRLDYVRLRGGVIANALALPSLRQPGILFTDTLLDRLDADEIVAIGAHEVAHLEHFNPRYLRRWRIVDWGVIFAGAFVVPALQPGTWGALLFATAVFGLLAFRGRHGQRNETASDLRAVELTGNAEALVRALVKLNTIARLPRRWDGELERLATHPSLARRIQQVRVAATAAAVPPPNASGLDEATCTSADGLATVTLAGGRLRVTHGDASEHVLAYGQLSELRVAAAGTGAPKLVAIDRTGRRWEVPLSAEDVPRVQAVLDRVDGQLAPRLELRRTDALPRAAAAAAALSVLASAHLTMLVTAVIALIKPGPRLLAAAGASAAMSGWLIVRDVERIGEYDPVPAFASIAFGSAVVLLVAAYTRRHVGSSRVDRIVAGALGAACVVSWCLVLLTGIHAVHLHDAVREWPSAPLLSLACAGALAFSRAALARAAVVLAALAGCAGSFLGSATFLAGFSGDPFVARGGTAGVRTIAGPPVAEFSLPNDAVDVRISPSAVLVAVSLGAGDDEESTFHMGRPGKALHPIAADDVVFVSDTQALVLRHALGSASVTSLRVGDPEEPLWRHELRRVASSRLSIDAAAGRWRLLGTGPANEIALAEGSLDGSAIEERRWHGTVPFDMVVEPIAVSGDRAIVRLTRYGRRVLDATRFWQWSSLLTPVFRFESRFEVWSSSAPTAFATSRLDVDCQTDDADGSMGVCWALDGHRTAIFAVDGNRLHPITSLDGDFLPNHRFAPGWLAGWRGGRPAALRLDVPEAVQIAGGGGFWIAQLIPLRDTIAAMVSNGEEVGIRIYDLRHQ